MAFGDADASTPPFVKAANAGNDVTTASFTPPAGALLVAWAWHDTAGGNVTNTSLITDSLGLTWTRRATRSKQDDGAGAANSHIAISTATATGSAMTVTSTGTNTNDPAGLYVRVITGADVTTPMDATPVEGTTNAAVVSTSIVTVTDGARCFLQVIDWNLAAAITAGTGQTAIVSDTIGGGPDDRVYLGVTNAVTSPAGSTTLSTGSPSTGNTNNWIGIAIRPASGVTVNAGNAAATVAANSATSNTSPAAGNAAVAVGAFNVTLTSGVTVNAGNAAVAVDANSATLAVGLPAGNAGIGAAANAVSLTSSIAAGSGAVSAAANGGTLTVGLPAGFAPVSVGAFDATLTLSGMSLLVGFGAVAVGAFGVTLVGGDQQPGEESAVSGSWQGLADILDEIRLVTAEERAAPLVACPRDGEPLNSVRGVLHCRYCGRRYVGTEQL